MSVQRFHGATNRDAMKRVRATLGDDALILANRAVEGSVEILALPESDATRLADNASDSRGAPAVMTPALSQPAAGRHTSPARDALWRQLRVAGFTRAFGESMLGMLPDHPDEHWLTQQLQARLKVAAPDALARSRVVVLLGPTGTGKTMTAAKLAASYASTHGRDAVALVGTDIYRMGAMQQLRGYADRLQVDLHTMEADLDLAKVVAGLYDKNLIIVDAPGFGPHDSRLAGQVRWLCDDMDVTPVLVLSATRDPEALEDALVHYRQVVEAAGARLDDVIVTKQDEASRIGPMLEVLIRQGLCLHYVSGGQRIPEDLIPADAVALAAEAFMAPARAIHAEAVPLAHQVLRQARALGDALALVRRHVPGLAWLEQAWPWRGLPLDEQQQRVGGLEPPDPMQPQMLWWYPGRPPATHGLDRMGRPLIGAFERFSTSDWASVFEQRPAHANLAAYLLPRLPHGRAWAWLNEQNLSWASRARDKQCVWHDGERRTLLECRPLAREAGKLFVRYRGRTAYALMRRVPVAGPLPGGKVSGLFEAWFVDVRAADSGVVMVRRYFLLPGRIDTETAANLVAAHLRNEALPGLVTRAKALLLAQPDVMPGAVHELLAVGLATLASRLDGEDDEWAMDLRVQLRNLSGNHRRHGARAVLEALVSLWATRDTLQQMGVLSPAISSEPAGAER